MELLSLNADFIPGVVFAYVSGLSPFCLGASVALRRGDLECAGGFEKFSDVLAEDYEMGRALLAKNRKIFLVPYFVEVVIGLQSFSHWWAHQIAWDQKTRAAQRAGFAATILTRGVPFALCFVLLRFGDATGLTVLAAALGIRWATAAMLLYWGLKDREGLKSLAFLPFRDVAALVFWMLALLKRTISWRGCELILKSDGRLERAVARERKTEGKFR
jgi:ceramide glucosyltransferase